MIKPNEHDKISIKIITEVSPPLSLLGGGGNFSYIYYDGYGTTVVMPTERRQEYDK